MAVSAARRPDRAGVHDHRIPSANVGRHTLRTVQLVSERQRPAVVRSSDIVWRTTRDRVLVRRVGSGDGAELVGLAALTWVAADTPATPAELARELAVDDTAVDEAVAILLSSGWLTQVSP